MKPISYFDSSTITTGYSIAKIIFARDLIEKSLIRLDLLSINGLEILMIKHPRELFVENAEKDIIVSADPNYELKRGDKLFVFG